MPFWRFTPSRVLPTSFALTLSEGRGRVGDLALSICAVLVAEACNIGLEPLVRPDVPALTSARLAWVQQLYSG